MAYDGPAQPTQLTSDLPDKPDEAETDAATDADRDRFGVHVLWEVFLAFVVILAGYGLYQLDAAVVIGENSSQFLLFVAALGLIASGVGWSLRSGVPNLAAGPLAVAAAVCLTDQGTGGFGFGPFFTLAAAGIVGAVLALVVVVFHVPAWGASLGLALLLAGWLGSASDLEFTDGLGYDPAPHALWWVIGFVVLSLAGGYLGILRQVRPRLAGFRADGDPAARPGFTPAVFAAAALIGSSMLAGAAGLLLPVAYPALQGSYGFEWTALGLGAALLGGTSAFGRRGGLFGTVLAVLLLVMGLWFAAGQHWNAPLLGYAGTAILVGLLVTRMVETLGSSPEDDEPDWVPRREVPEPPATQPAKKPVAAIGATPAWEAPPSRSGSAVGGTRPLLALPSGESSRSYADAPTLHPGSTRLAGERGTSDPGSIGARPAGQPTVSRRTAPDRLTPPPLRGGIGDRASRLAHRFGGTLGDASRETSPTLPSPSEPTIHGTTSRSERPGQVVSGQVISGQVVPGKVVPGQVVPGQVVPGQVVPGQVAPGQAAPTSGASGRTAFGADPRHALPGRAIPHQGPGPAVSGQTVPGQVPLGEVPPEQVAPRQVPPGRTVPEQPGPGTPGQHTPDVSGASRSWFDRPSGADGTPPSPRPR